jgi:hypothetical protein
VLGMSGGSGASIGQLFDAVAGEYEATGTRYFPPMGRRLVALSGVEVGNWVLLFDPAGNARQPGLDGELYDFPAPYFVTGRNYSGARRVVLIF